MKLLSSLAFGIGLTMAAFSLAINTYFLQKRGRAMGLAMTITGLGPIIMPQIITLLADTYPTQVNYKVNIKNSYVIRQCWHCHIVCNLIFIFIFKNILHFLKNLLNTSASHLYDYQNSEYLYLCCIKRIN